MDKQNKEVNCCPVFDPAQWNEQMYTWENKMFIRGTMPQILHYPLSGHDQAHHEKTMETGH